MHGRGTYVKPVRKPYELADGEPNRESDCVALVFTEREPNRVAVCNANSCSQLLE